MASKTVNTRIQLKSDTEMNWRKSVLKTDHTQGLKETGTSFVPLAGELIIYSPDNGSPAYCRLKVGDGSHNVLDLPFIDAGTVNGEVLSDIIITAADRYAFPAIGQDNKLYVDLENNIIYCYKQNSGFSQLSHFKYTTIKTSISTINNWNPGIMTTALTEGSSLIINNGVAPTLDLGTLNVVTDITEVNE